MVVHMVGFYQRNLLGNILSFIKQPLFVIQLPISHVSIYDDVNIYVEIANFLQFFNFKFFKKIENEN